MGLIESLFAGIGTAIGKSILKLWLKDEPLLAAGADKATDLLAKHVEDFRQRRAAAQQIERISIRAADSILALLDKEGSDIPEARREVIANAAGEAIAGTPISTALLAERNLDPGRLAAHFRERPGSQGGNPLAFASAAERDLYGRILFHAAQLIVDVAGELPAFDKAVAAELLDRQDLLTSKADQVIAGMDRLLAAQAGKDLADERFETDLRNACVRHFDHLELFGVDLHETNQRYRLSVAYVSLEVERGLSPVHRHRDQTASEEDEDAPLLETLPVERVLALAPRLFVRGAAGSGKTTLVQWLAVQAAGRTLTEGLEGLNDRVPLVVKLRDLGDRPLPGPEELPGLISPALGGKPEQWVHRRLDAGRAMILIDGLDEASHAERARVRAWVADLVAQYPKARFLVTSRPHAAAEGWLDAQDFVEASLQPLGRGDVHRFIDHWHQAVAEGLRDPAHREALPDLAQALKQQIDRSAGLRRLADTPLLCAILCALHRDRRQQLPEDRLELYRACVEMFFRRDRERRVPMTDYPALSDKQAQFLLQDLAWWMIRNWRSAASPAEIDERLGRGLAQLPKAPADADGPGVRRLLVERVGILRALADSMIDFPHKTFQEYLAALAAIQENDLSALVRNAHDDQWREVAIMAAGLLGPDQAAGFVADLLKRADADRAAQRVLILVAAAALDLVPALPQGSPLPQEVRKRLARVVPPRGMTAAKALAKAGDLVVPLLAGNAEWKVSEAAAAIRTLSLIDTETALAVAGSWAGDGRTGVTRELGRFALLPPELGAVVFGATRKLDLSRSGISQIRGLANCSALQSLTKANKSIAM